MEPTRQMSEGERRQVASAVAAAKATMDVLNTLGSEKAVIDAFVGEVLNEHRTVQQGMGRLVCALIEGWAAAYESGRYDLRNEATVTWAAKLELPHLPLI